MVNQNLHIHSKLSGCASKEMSVEAIVAEAKKGSLEVIAIVDHIDNPKTRMRRGKELIQEYKRVKGELDLPSNFQMLLGCETTQISPTTFSIDDKTADRMDIVLVSSNHYHLKYVDKPLDVSPKQFSNHYLSMLEGALDWEYTDIIAHPFHLHKLKWIDHVQVLKSYDRSRLKDILAVASDRNIAFEMCPRHFKKHIDFFVELLSYGREFGVRFSVGTDAHKLDQVCYKDGDMKRLKELGIEKCDLWEGRGK